MLVDWAPLPGVHDLDHQHDQDHHNALNLNLWCRLYLDLHRNLQSWGRILFVLHLPEHPHQPLQQIHQLKRFMGFYPNKYFLKRIVSLISSKTYFFKSWIQSHYCNLWVTFQFKRAILIAQFKTVHIKIIVWSKVSFFQLSSEIS